MTSTRKPSADLIMKRKTKQIELTSRQQHSQKHEEVDAKEEEQELKGALLLTLSCNIHNREDPNMTTMNKPRSILELSLVACQETALWKLSKSKEQCTMRCKHQLRRNQNG